jgi:hypothetical protein
MRRRLNSRGLRILLSVLVVGAMLPLGAQAPDTLLYLHSAGSDFLNTTLPTATTAKFKDSTSINFANGNPWKDIGTWTASPGLTAGTLTAVSELRVWLGLKNSDDQGTSFDLQAEVY